MSSETITAHILIVEDEPAIRDLLKLTLKKQHHKVTEADSAEQARLALDDPSIDIALVDWMLPGGSGLELVRSLRKSDTFQQLPVIMVTARTEENYISEGLDAGADDYVSKPFSPRELLSRIQAVLRRRGNIGSNALLTNGALTLDIHAHEVKSGDTTLEMGHTEFKLLTFFMQNPNRVYSRSQILDQVWGTGTFIEERTVDVHILRLRKVLKNQGLEHLVETVRGVGYRLKNASVEA
ncbi:MAG: response regulator [Granulosicoccus sp.]|nr:response regulator [Granulosicoccus sp.]